MSMAYLVLEDIFFYFLKIAFFKDFFKVLVNMFLLILCFLFSKNKNIKNAFDLFILNKLKSIKIILCFFYRKFMKKITYT